MNSLRKRPALRVGLALWAALLLSGCGGGEDVIVPTGGAGTLTATSPGELAWAQDVFSLTNDERAAQGLPPLVFDRLASEAAYAHAWDMDLRNFFDHVNPDGDGPEERLTAHGLVFDDARENIARAQRTPAQVMQAWMDSESHRANILFAGWTHIGVAVHSGAADGPWWAQEFYRF